MGILAMFGNGQIERTQKMDTTRDVAASSPDKRSLTKVEEHTMIPSIAPKTLSFTDENFDRQVLQAETPVLVDFWAEWCSPCRVLGPRINELADEYAGKIRIGKVDIDANQEVLARYGIGSIPTVLLFVNGEIQARFAGLRSKKEYQ